MKNFKGFTLAEVLITLTVIGVITAIIIPVAIHSKPDENVMKFKKGHNTLFQAMNILINSDKYFQNGDLAIASGGESLNYVQSNISEQEKLKKVYYFCKSFADVVSVKKENCELEDFSTNTQIQLMGSVEIGTFSKNDDKKTCLYTQQDGDLDKAKNEFDKKCKNRAYYVGHDQIVTVDGNTFFDATLGSTFGHRCSLGTFSGRCFSPPDQNPANFHDENGFDIAYKVFCLDIDGMGEVRWQTGKTNEYCDDVKDICPFGYGIRADGTILTGKRADEWLNKSTQGE